MRKMCAGTCCRYRTFRNERLLLRYHTDDVTCNKARHVNDV